jgi:DNA uptake protein ComE-like DNA-binding protein
MLGQVAGAVLLGPAGIAAMFADLNLGGGNPCAGALQEAAKGVKAPTAEGTQKEEKTESPAGDAAAEQEKKGWQPGSVLKKIFRK